MIVYMLFKKPRDNCFFIIGLAISNLIFEKWLDSLDPSNMINQGPPPWIVQYLSTIVILVIGVYLILHLTLTAYSNLGPKLKRIRHNLYVYGIKSSAALVIVLGDATTLLVTEGNFYNSAFHFTNTLSPLEIFFIDLFFPILGIFLIWNLRNQKIEFEELSPMKS